MSETTVSFVNVFFNFQDACMWMDHHLEEHPGNEWNVLECRIVFLNGAWRAGVVFERKPIT